MILFFFFLIEEEIKGQDGCRSYTGRHLSQGPLFQHLQPASKLPGTPACPRLLQGPGAREALLHP